MHTTNEHTHTYTKYLTSFKKKLNHRRHFEWQIASWMRERERERERERDLVSLIELGQIMLLILSMSPGDQCHFDTSHRAVY